MRTYFNNLSSRAFAAWMVVLFAVTFLLTLFLMAGTAATAEAAGASPSTGFSHASATKPTTPDWAWRKNWEACTEGAGEGAPRCVWHARTSGNGLGSSYLRTNSGKVIRIPHRDAAALLRPTYAL